MNTFGQKFRISVFGESHGPAVGLLIDGVPPGICLCEEDFLPDIDRRRSGAPGTTPRREEDLPQLLSGVYRGKTTGAPLAVIFRNGNVRSADYDLFRDIPRPGHADRTAALKWGGFNDPRGGGHFSGRLTLPLVAAGTVAKLILARETDGRATVSAAITELGGIPRAEAAQDVLPPPGCGTAVEQDAALWKKWLDEAAAAGDSLGAVVRCCASGLPSGLGEPFFDSAEALLSHAVFSIPGVRAVAFGDGFAAARMKGSAHNDPFGPDGKPAKNGSGGFAGGITTGADVVFDVALKPTSSISAPQKTFNFASGEEDILRVPGRHDVCFALRTPVIVEAVTALVFADLLLRSA